MQRITTATRAIDLFGAGKDGFRDGDLAQAIAATDFNAAWFNQIQEEIASFVEAAGIALNVNDRAQLRKSIARFYGGNITTVNAAASPFAITADHAGILLVDASAGSVVLNLPLANSLLGLGLEIRRTDISANSVTVNRAGADVIDDVQTSFSLVPKQVQRIRSVAAALWATLSEKGNDAGRVSFFARNTAPPGFLKANGAAVSRTTYAALFSAIGTTFGVGDGATTFTLPDLRGEFPRGWDDGRGVDTGRVFGSAQAHALQTHTHSYNAPVATPDADRGTTASDWSIDSGIATYSSGNNTGNTATETRPRNIALLACIKY